MAEPALQGGALDGANPQSVKKLARFAEAVEKKFSKVEQAYNALQLTLKASQDALSFGATLKKTLSKIVVSTQGIVAAIGQGWYFIAGMLVLFIVHQLFLWVDQDPDIAFERAGVFFEAAEVTWDFTSVLWNAGVDVFNAGVIPVWNTATYYLVEPSVVLVLEIFSLVFLRQHWNGLFSEKDFPYNGLDCTATPESAAWCGRYGYYKEALEGPTYAPAYVDDSAAYEARRHLEERNYTFGLATARHLQELSGGGFSVPVFDSSALTEALDALATFLVTMMPSLLDVVFGILMDVIRTSFSVVMDALFLILKQAMWVLKMLVSALCTLQPTRTHLHSFTHSLAPCAESGMLTTLITLGVDFIVIGLTEIALPLLFAAIDGLMCLLDYFKPSGWNDQLECEPKFVNPTHYTLRTKKKMLNRSPRSQVRRGAVLQGARRRRRPPCLLLAAHHHRPLHGCHGRDAQLAHGQALLQGTQGGRGQQQGAHARPDLGPDDRQQRARERADGQPHVRV